MNSISKELQKYLDKSGEKMKSISPDILMQEFMDRLHDPNMIVMRVGHFLYTEQQKILSKHKEILTVIKGD
jgi:2C-methyl-D-erythritol 2,4-cyclodiphosphate synthase